VRVTAVDRGGRAAYRQADMRGVRAAAAASLLALSACHGADHEPRPAPTHRPFERVVGYFANWGVYARDYQVKDVETSGAADRLTDLVYAFGGTDQGRCRPGDAYADHGRRVAAAESVDGRADAPGQPVAGNINQLRKLKQRHPGLRVLWSFGGWTGSQGFSAAAGDPARFAASCADLLDDPRWAGVFDGIDIDWEYPNSCGQTCDTSGRESLRAVVAALRAKLGANRLITAAISGDAEPGGALDAADYAGAAAGLDWVNAMTYDYFGAGAEPGPTAPHSPLTAYPGIPDAADTVEATVAKLRGMGVPARKILLGIGLYGRGWTGVTSAAPGGASTGRADGTYEKGVEDYRVLTRSCPPVGTVGGTAYAFCRGQWWSYDTPATVAGKLAWARGQGLGGAFVWELSGDTADGELLAAIAAASSSPSRSR
jgi:chitinase